MHGVTTIPVSDHATVVYGTRTRAVMHMRTCDARGRQCTAPPARGRQLSLGALHRAVAKPALRQYHTPSQRPEDTHARPDEWPLVLGHMCQRTLAVEPHLAAASCASERPFAFRAMTKLTICGMRVEHGNSANAKGVCDAQRLVMGCSASALRAPRNRLVLRQSCEARGRALGQCSRVRLRARRSSASARTRRAWVARWQGESGAAREGIAAGRGRRRLRRRRLLRGPRAGVS